MGSGLASALLGLASAACWGAGDFCGGLASRRTRVYGVVIVSQAMGLALLFGLALLVRERVPPAGQLLWGGLAGISGAIGLTALYQALASGRMRVAAPVSAVLTAMVPVLAGMALEGWPGASQFLGFGLALIGVWLVSRGDDAPSRLNDVGLPVLAGLGFGFFLVFIDRASDASALWPLVAARFASCAMTLCVALLTRRAWRPAGGLLPLIGAAGVLDVAGNASYALATQLGRLDVAAVIASLYPASTVMLARIVLKERMTRTQLVGVAAALAAIILITLPGTAT